MLWADIVYVLLLLFSIAVGPVYRKISDPKLKQWTGTAIGLLLATLVSGSHVLHPLIMTVVNGIIISTKSIKTQHLCSLFFSFFHLLVVFRLGGAMGLSVPPTHTNLIMMIMTIKLPGLAFEINSAASISDKDHDSEGVRSDAMKRPIGFMDVFHYSFGYMGVLTGPYYRYRTYWDSLYRPFPNHADPWPPTVQKLKQTVVFAILFLIAKEQFPTEYILTKEFEQRAFLYRFFYIYPAFAVFRLRMFVGMMLSECSCQMSGLGAYPSICKPLPGLGPKDYTTVVALSSAGPEKLKSEKYDFETVHNMDVWEVETCLLVRTAMKVWNACIQYWMATCIYKRFPNRSLRTVVTMLLSALWHGYAAGYYFCICQVPLYLPLEDITVKFYRQSEENSPAKKFWTFALWYMRLTCMAYLGIPFMLLNLQEIIHFYKSLHFAGHFLGLFLYAVVRCLKPYLLQPTPPASKQEKVH